MIPSALRTPCNTFFFRCTAQSPCVHLCARVCVSQVLHVTITHARKLIGLPNLKPRVELQVRGMKLSTAVGTARPSSGGGIEFEFGAGGELALPIREAERDGVIIVRVFNDGVGKLKKPALIGQWCLTLTLTPWP